MFAIFMKDMIISSHGGVNMGILKIVFGITKVLLASTTLERHTSKLVTNTLCLRLQVFTNYSFNGGV